MRYGQYAHIPFCSVRCKFCEYTVLPDWSEAAEAEYMDLLLREIALFVPFQNSVKCKRAR